MIKRDSAAGARAARARQQWQRQRERMTRAVERNATKHGAWGRERAALRDFAALAELLNRAAKSK